MLRYMTVLVWCPLFISFLQAQENTWSLHESKNNGLTIHGKILSGKGITGTCRLLDGNTVISVDDSERLTEGPQGFSLTAWVNPYSLNGSQQMIAAKNRYSLNERQWGVMLDKDNRFRLYTYQGAWVTAESVIVPKPGHWYFIGVIVDQKKAELWVNGKLAERISIHATLPRTAAPVTFGGVNDHGRRWQYWTGAIDRATIYSRPLSAEEMTSKYKPIEATHDIPAAWKPFELWSGGEFPKTKDLGSLKDVEFHVIKKHEPQADGYNFLHGVGLAWHKGKLYASLGHNKGSENTFTEEGRFCVSHDGGETWSGLKTIDQGLEAKNLAISHGVFLSHGETLWAFLGAFYDRRQRVHTRAYRLNESTGKWEPQGVVIEGGFWPMTEPVKMANGNWILAGLVVGKKNSAGVAISNGENFTDWDLTVLPVDNQIGTMWGESTTITDGPHVLNISRYGAKPMALAAESRDYGKTWSLLKVSNLPMAGSKPYAGVLSNGQRYLICSMTADGGHRRSPLTIAVSRPGKKTFSKTFVIRHAIFEAGPGESHAGAALSYPYAIEYQDKLYVGYSNNGPRKANLNSAELAIIPLRSLKID